MDQPNVESQSPHTIPPELLRPILDHLRGEKGALHAISLSSKSLCAEGQRLLFHDVTMLTAIDQHTNFLSIIIESPDRLALLVQKYTRCDIAAGDQELDIRSYEALNTLTGAALAVMNNLKHLKLRASFEGPSVFLLHGCKFNLEALELTCHRYSDVGELLHKFLSSQTTLKHLCLDWNDNVESIPTPSPALCPQLVSLEGCKRVIEAFLPGRELTTLLERRTRSLSQLNR